MSTKKRKKSDEDDQEYFDEECNTKTIEKMSFAKVCIFLEILLMSKGIMYNLIC